MQIRQTQEKIIISSSSKAQIIFGLFFVFVGIIIMMTLSVFMSLAIVVGVIFVFVGVSISLSIKGYHTEIRKDGTCFTRVGNFLSGKKIVKNFNKSEIAYLLLETYVESSAVVEPRAQRKHKISLILKNNERIEVGIKTDNAFDLLDQIASKDAIVSSLSNTAKQIGDYLGIPVKHSTTRGTITTPPSKPPLV